LSLEAVMTESTEFEPDIDSQWFPFHSLVHWHIPGDIQECKCTQHRKSSWYTASNSQWVCCTYMHSTLWSAVNIPFI